MNVSRNSGRDLRIDFLRGLALLIIASDHIPENPVAKVTPYSVCYFDMSEVFVFLSGYVCGISYNRTLVNFGFAACQLKAFRRWIQIYAAHVTTLLLHLFILALFAARLESASENTVSNYLAFEQHPYSFIKDIFLLKQRVAFFDILPVYLALLPFLPIALYARRLNFWVLPVLSLALYFGVLLFRWDAILLPHWSWSLQPLSWQLLFIGGAFLATSNIAKRVFLPKSVSAGYFALIIFVGLIELRTVAAVDLPLTNRNILEPIRLIHLFSAATVAQTMIFSKFHPGKSTWSRPIIACGQNSLVTYCVGALASNMVTLLPITNEYEVSWASTVNVIVWCTCIAAAYTSARLSKTIPSVMKAMFGPRAPHSGYDT